MERKRRPGGAVEETSLSYLFDISQKGDKFMAETAHLETEPIFGIRIEFCDGSKPMEWFNLNLKQTAKVLTDMSEDWILVPEDVKLNDEIWKWHANVRHREAESRGKTETYADILDPLYYPEIEED